MEKLWRSTSSDWHQLKGHCPTKMTSAIHSYENVIWNQKLRLCGSLAINCSPHLKRLLCRTCIILLQSDPFLLNFTKVASFKVNDLRKNGLDYDFVIFTWRQGGGGFNEDCHVNAVYETCCIFTAPISFLPLYDASLTMLLLLHHPLSSSYNFSLFLFTVCLSVPLPLFFSRCPR